MNRDKIEYLVEDCKNWSELLSSHGHNCYNCVHRDGFPFRGQPEESCGNFVPKTGKRKAGDIREVRSLIDYLCSKVNMEKMPERYARILDEKFWEMI